MRDKGRNRPGRLKRNWPHHVALPAEKVHGVANSAAVRGFAHTLSAAPMQLHMRRGHSDFVVFCFTKPEDAQVFAEQFGGERLATGSRR